MHRTRLWLGLALALGAIAAAPAARAVDLRVMTQNLYIGTGLAPVLTATTVEEFEQATRELLAVAAANDFTTRAAALAEIILAADPDVVGLQEVSDFLLDGMRGDAPYLDYLDVLMTALDAAGARYVVAAVVTNLDAELTLNLDEDAGTEVLRLVDRDVLLVREGLTFETLEGDFSSGGVCGVPLRNPYPLPLFPRQLAPTPSDDGCNYTAGGSLFTPAGDVDVPRGFVAIDVTLAERTVRVFNTHLEVQTPLGGLALSAILPSTQAYELTRTVRRTTPPGRPVVLLGDFNSSLSDPMFGGFITPYQRLFLTGFRDAWWMNLTALRDPLGRTCCQAGDLANATSSLSTRIDHVWVRGPGIGLLSRVRVVSDEPLAGGPPGPPNWPSDHAGVVAVLRLR